MLPESHLAIVARNERWQGECSTEPLECGWAREAVLFLRALDDPRATAGQAARVEISPDGIHWCAEGSTLPLPVRRDETTAARVRRFGGWLRLAATLPEGAGLTVLVAIHLKA